MPVPPHDAGVGLSSGSSTDGYRRYSRDWRKNVSRLGDYVERPIMSLIKSTKNTYSGMHQRVKRIRGAPQHCEKCGKVGRGYYEWASLTRNYADPFDYIRLCAPCHRHLDRSFVNAIAATRARQAAKTHCPKGHPYSGDNLFQHKDGRRECRICRRTSRLESYHRVRRRIQCGVSET